MAERKRRPDWAKTVEDHIDEVLREAADTVEDDPQK